MKIACVLVVLSSVVLCEKRDEYTPEGWFYRSEVGVGEVPTDIPRGAVGIYLNDNNIETIRASDFSDMTSLTFLGLHSNVISEIDTNAFADLGKVTELWLQNNNLKRVRGNMFRGLSSLTDLLLSNNPIDYIETDAWVGVGKLQELYLHTTLLRELWPDTFSGLPDLMELTLTNNKIHRIQDGCFRGLMSLKKLWLDSNDLTELKYETFLGLENLERLALHSNNLTTIIGGVFSGLFNLRVLDLDDNQISSIRSDSFRGMDRLDEVWLYNNKLTTFSASTFVGLPRPLSLTLGMNPLQCGADLCWLKQGYVTWLEFAPRARLPQCDNGVTWDQLSCQREIDECPDPGQVLNSKRSGSGPFKIGTELTYTCDFCYMGSGSTTCEKEGKWTEIPKCEPVKCQDPGHPENGARMSDGPFTCGYLVGYECDEDYRMVGEALLVCRGDGAWSNPRPQCLKIPNTKNLPDCKTSLDDTRWLIIAIVAGVAGLFLAVICTATCMECCCRRRRKIKG